MVPHPRLVTRAPWPNPGGKAHPVARTEGAIDLRFPGLADLRFHGLRHAYAIHLLAKGVHPKVASERLGHRNVGIILKLYSHVIPGMQEDAAAMVETC